MPEITCPECGQRAELAMVRRNADEFCTHCEFPLFWAETSLPAMTPGTNSDSTLRRRPGVDGRRRVGSKICPECGELNPVGNTHCIRCTAELDPKPPPPPPPPVPRPEPVPEPEPVVAFVAPDPGTRWDYWVLGGLLIAGMIAAVIASI